MRGDLARVAQRIDFAGAGTTGVMESVRGHAPTPSGGGVADSHHTPHTPLSGGQAERVKRHVEAADAALAAHDLDAALREPDLAAELASQDPRVVDLLRRVQAAQVEHDSVHCLADAQRELAAGALSRASQLVQMALTASPHDPRVQQIKLELDLAFRMIPRPKTRAGPPGTPRARPGSRKRAGRPPGCRAPRDSKRGPETTSRSTPRPWPSGGS